MGGRGYAWAVAAGLNAALAAISAKLIASQVLLGHLTSPHIFQCQTNLTARLD